MRGPSALRRRLERSPGRPAAGPAAWRVLVPVVCLVAGVGFAASANDSRGTDLRATGTASLVDSVRSAEGQVQDLDEQVRAAAAQVAQLEKAAGRDDGAVASAQQRVGPLQQPAGLTAVQGPGLIVTLDDAGDAASDPGDPTAGDPGGGSVDPNNLVVHQSDLQAVVNALWAGGAEAMSIAGQRVIATSAVRCVGNTLLLNGDVYSPPFRVAAIGPSSAMRDRLDASRGVRLFRDAAAYYGLGYTVEASGRVELPAYSGSLTVSYATR